MISPAELLEGLLYITIPSSIFLVAIAIILIVSSQLLSSSYGRINILIDKRRFRNAMILAVVALMIVIALIIFVALVDPVLFEDYLHSYFNR